jgi:NadR type nicotinamide-nucleotide adenylyltransferase
MTQPASDPAEPPDSECPTRPDPSAFGLEQPPGHGVGVILGRFMPPHLGHQYLIEFAANYVSQLTVLIRGRSKDVIPGDQRVYWLREMFPEVSVILVHDNRAPKEGDVDTTFYNRWNLKIRQQVPTGLDYLFASEKYGPRLAEMLGANYIPVDPNRVTVPISGTQIRQDPLLHWDFLPPCVRPYYLRRVCLVGPDSAARSILAAKLAKHFATCFVGEYAQVLRQQKRDLDPADVQAFARAQLAAELTLARRANRVLFLAADLLAIQLWSELRFGMCPEWIAQEAKRRHYDLYLVTDWVAPDQHPAFLQRYLDTLQAHGLNSVRLSGSPDERFEQAVAAVGQLLRKK